MTEVIRTVNLSKKFKSVKAVVNLSLNIKEGEIYGFLGLNGAGKTTTIRMLLSLIRPTSGKSYIFGKEVLPGQKNIWNDIGYLVEIPYSYPELTVRENLEIVRRMRSVTDTKATDRIIDQLKLSEYSDRKAKNLSQGNSQRLGLAKALLHNPRILILDEPANGLDPSGIVEIRELLRNLSVNKGVTVFISSHILSEISKVATRIGIIHEGYLIQEFKASQLDQLCRKHLLVETPDINSAVSLLSLNGYSPIINDKRIILLKEEKAIDHPDDIARLLVTSEVPLLLLKVEEEDLESYFLRIISMKGGAV